MSGVNRAWQLVMRTVPGAAARAYRHDERAYAEWRQRNPGKKRADYYAALVSTGLDKGASHPTLGGTLDGAVPYEQSGVTELERLRNAGLKPHHVCVDYGCGSLRVGQHLIRYLNASRYWGLDTTDQFFKMGVDLIGQALVRDKQPHLHVIAPAALADTAAARPDFIYSNAVVLHVPPEEIEEFWQNVMALFNRSTTALINIRLSRTAKRISSRSWAYTESELVRLAETLGGRVIAVDRLPPQRSKHSWTRDVYPAWMTITSAAANA
jgi:hypothetical protein